MAEEKDWQQTDLSRVVKLIYKYSLNPGVTGSRLAILREAVLQDIDDVILEELGEHLHLAYQLSNYLSSEDQNSLVHIRFDSKFRIMEISEQAQIVFSEIFECLDVGARLMTGDDAADAQLIDGVEKLRRNFPGARMALVLNNEETPQCFYLYSCPDGSKSYYLYAIDDRRLIPGDKDLTLLQDLTKREREVCDLIYGGLSVQQVSDQLNVSTNTVKYHLKSIFSKLGVNKRIDLARLLKQAYEIEHRVDQMNWRASHENRINGLPVIGMDDLEDHPDKQHIAVGGGRAVAWREYGPVGGRPVLWIHPGFSSGRLWSQAIEAAGKHKLRIICIDRPGYSQTTRLHVPNPDGVLRDELAVLDHIGIQECDVVSAALGTMYALHLAAAVPNRVRSVYLASANVNAEARFILPYTTWNFVMRLAHLHPDLVRDMLNQLVASHDETYRINEMRRLFQVPSGETVVAMTDDQINRMTALLSEAIENGVGGIVGDYQTVPQIQVNFAEVAQRTIEFHGDQHNHWQSDQWARELLSPIPNFEQVIVPGGDHFFFFDQFDFIARHIGE